MEKDSRTRIEQGAFGGSLWGMASREPCAPLRPYVRKLVGYDERSPRPQSRRQFPEPSVVLVIEFGPPSRIRLGGDERTAAHHPGGFVAGLADVFAITEHEGHQRGVQVDLSPTGARRFPTYRCPSSRARSRRSATFCPPSIPRWSRSWKRRLTGRRGWTSSRNSWRGAFSPRGWTPPAWTGRWRASSRPAARWTWACWRESSVTVASTSLRSSATRWVSHRSSWRLVRFERVVRQARGGGRIRWAELAFAHGYCDQAHLARDVMRFTGLTPTETRASLSELADLFG